MSTVQEIITPDLVCTRLGETMFIVLASTVYVSLAEKIEALENMYKGDQFIVGAFSAEKTPIGYTELSFAGTVCGERRVVCVS